MEQTESTIRKMIAEIAGIALDSPSEEDLYLDLGVASVHAMQLLIGLEKSFGLSIPDDDFIAATTISKLVEMIDSLNRQVPKGSAHA
jgi:acyl carrier protein